MKTPKEGAYNQLCAVTADREGIVNGASIMSRLVCVGGRSRAMSSSQSGCGSGLRISTVSPLILDCRLQEAVNMSRYINSASASGISVCL